MAMMTRFASSQQFDLALQAGRLVFDPYADGTAVDRCWKWPPFRKVSARDDLQKLLKNKDGHLDGAVYEWAENPFSPYVIARSRPSTYMKWIVMKVG